MKVQSTVYPESFLFKGDVLLLRENVIEKTNEEGDVVFEYDEYNTTIIMRPNVEQYIENNFN